MLGIISIVIIVVFSMMLTTSYAWYSFENASTSFQGMTNNDDIIINYQHGEYINTMIALPISSSDIDEYADKNNFSIEVKNNEKDIDIAVNVSLVDITIDSVLRNANFKVDMYYQGEKWSSAQGNTIGTGGATTLTFKNITTGKSTIILDNDISNLFEIRVYLLDDGSNQNTLMNRTFQAKIQVDVVSRLNNTFEDYSGADIYVSGITIDGEESKSLPVSGYYSMTSSCEKAGENTLTWEPLSKTLTYSGGAIMQDSCSLAFTSSTDYPLLSEMPVGSYVKYVGNNGCEGNHCKGYNANYESEDKMGFCNDPNYQFHVNGWRIGYIDDNDDEDASNDNAVLISAGATDCMCTLSDGTPSSSSCSDSLSADDISKHYDNMKNIALKYCNSEFIKNGTCGPSAIDNGYVKVMNTIDFQKISGDEINLNSCYNSSSNMVCGYNNDLIDNGSDYWFGDFYSNVPETFFNWGSNSRKIINSSTNFLFGVRPVLFLDSSVVVVDGNGSYEDPFLIRNTE